MPAPPDKGLVLLTTTIFVFVFFLACKFCFESPRRSYSRHEIMPYQVKEKANKYRLFIYSSGKLRQVVLFLVILSFWYVISEPFKSPFLINISYSLIATFIFDTGLNFNKENIAKSRSSEKWHAELYSAFDRDRSLKSIYFPNRKLISSEELAKALSSSLFLSDATAYATRSVDVMWSSFSDSYLSYKSLKIEKGMPLQNVAMMFLEEDLLFIRNLTLDNDVFFCFPTLKKKAYLFHRVSVNLIHSLKDPNRFHADEKSINDDLLIYLDCRKEFLSDAEDVMGHYEQRSL